MAAILFDGFGRISIGSALLGQSSRMSNFDIYESIFFELSCLRGTCAAAAAAAAAAVLVKPIYPPKIFLVDIISHPHFCV